jgi:arginase family enzyme
MLDRLDELLPQSLPPFVLYGSGDFHHLSGLWLKRAAAKVAGPITLISFDNHPDCDIRPPRWACGGWINRAMEIPSVHQAHVWGCGNFELGFPSRLFANRAAIKAGNLIIHPWAERQGPEVQKRFACMTRQNWRDQFSQFAQDLKNKSVYVTVDMDCLDAAEASTNWEAGLFTAEDIAWALGQITAAASLIGGDVCGAFSPPLAHGFFRRLAIRWDHPKLVPVNLADARRMNTNALGRILPALVTNA